MTSRPWPPRSTRSSPTRTRRPAATGCARRPWRPSSRTTRPDGDEDRTFILFAETARNGILAAPGFGLTVDRIYATYPDGRRRRMVPRRHPFRPRSRSPAFAWDGDTADITAAWNDGRYLMVHRDHGGTDAWGNPRFATTDVDALTNGAELPVVLSINCSSGAFQDDDARSPPRRSSTRTAARSGVFGDTEVSPTATTRRSAGASSTRWCPRPGRRGPRPRAADRRGADPRQERGWPGSPRPGSPTATAAPATSSTCGTTSATRRCRCGAASPISVPDHPRLPVRFRSRTYRPAAARPAALRRRGDAAGGVQRPGVQPAAQRRGGRQGRRRRREGGRSRRRSTTAQPKPGELQVAFEGDGAVPITDPGRRACRRAPTGAAAELPVGCRRRIRS